MSCSARDRWILTGSNAPEPAGRADDEYLRPHLLRVDLRGAGTRRTPRGSHACERPPRARLVSECGPNAASMSVRGGTPARPYRRQPRLTFVGARGSTSTPFTRMVGEPGNNSRSSRWRPTNPPSVPDGARPARVGLGELPGARGGRSSGTRRGTMRMRHPSSAARAIRNNPAPTRTAPMARATRSPAGARRSTVMAAATTAIARRSMTPMTRRIAIGPAQQ